MSDVVVKRFFKGYIDVAGKQEIDNYVKLNRYKIKAIKTDSTDMQGIKDEIEEFIIQGGDILTNICAEVRDDIEKELRGLIIERAYFSGENSVFYKSTMEFADVSIGVDNDEEHTWYVDVYVGEMGTLHFNIYYFPQNLTYKMIKARKGTKTRGKTKVIRPFSIHAGSFGYKRGYDMRQALADILNTPKKMDTKSNGGTRVREGYWYNRIDDYCRKEATNKFIELCKQNGLM